MLSGRCTAMVSGGRDTAASIVGKCCFRLGIRHSGTEKLVHGTEVVPNAARVSDWPGLRPEGEVSEYQLVVRAPDFFWFDVT
eukprot:3735276-Amphidinium_carterae.1